LNSEESNLDLPSIALITPTLNQAAFLPATLAAVLAQDYPALDYWVIDGGSSDGTLEILRTSGPGVHWLSEPDSGQSAAINKGWRKAQGEILGWLNSDDLLTPGALAQVGAYFAAHPTVDFLYGDCDFLDSAGAIIGQYPVRLPDYNHMLLYADNYIPQPAAFFRRRALEAVGGLDEDLHYVMDFDLWLRLGLRGEGAYLPTKLAGLRLHADAKSVARLGRFAAENVRVVERLLDQPGLPAPLRAGRRQALGSVYLKAADSAFWAGELTQARGYAWRAWRCQPLRPRRLWLWLLLGAAGRRWAEQRYGNPYSRGQHA
jgi:glycosyltransferase involved in cell wall biosynthesis